MSHHWWKDLLDRNNRWQGLELYKQADSATTSAMEMRSGHNGRMALYIREIPLFWASMLNDHSGVWLVMNDAHSDQQALLPPVTSQDVEWIQRRGASAWSSEWCRYFARRLLDAPVPLLSARRWLLRPMFPVTPTAPYPLEQKQPIERWHFQTPPSTNNINCNWTLYGENFPDLTTPERISLVDWWWGEDRLLGRYPIKQETGRLKWWRKKCREGTLPPILVWYIAGLASFIILDGHYRLQAAIEEKIPPQFLVLSEFSEQTFKSDPEHQTRVLQALERQQLHRPDCNIDGINQTLINLYDTRYFYAPTYSRAVLGKGESWEQEVTDYLHKHRADDYQEKIIRRIT
ncbi:hypothetical protein [Pectobacterium sp. B1J-3]|uniref:hypothetical protein n=1 Tax=Pectobacterium sp. B1J-3 TaxID=3385371 RepID=UPI0039067AF4